MRFVTLAAVVTALTACSGPSKEAEREAWERTKDAARGVVCGESQEERASGLETLVDEIEFYQESERAHLAALAAGEADCGDVIPPPPSGFVIEE